MASEHHRRVLIVDDDADIRQLLITAFRMKKLEVDAATNGQEAMDLLRAQSYCVVLLDLFMPIMDGFAVLEQPLKRVGFGQGGLLTDSVDQHPHCVMLLDEIEKAHPDLYNVLLQIMDHGRLTDHNG